MLRKSNSFMCMFVPYVDMLLAEKTLMDPRTVEAYYIVPDAATRAR